MRPFINAHISLNSGRSRTARAKRIKPQEIPRIQSDTLGDIMSGKSQPYYLLRWNHPLAYEYQLLLRKVRRSMWIHNYESIRQTIQRSPCSPCFTVQKMATRNALFSRPWASEENPPEDMLVKQGAEKSSVGKKCDSKMLLKKKQKAYYLRDFDVLFLLVWENVWHHLTPWETFQLEYLDPSSTALPWLQHGQPRYQKVPRSM